MELSEEQLNTLITCPKTIVKKPRTSMALEHRFLRNDFTAVCQDTGEKFRVFMRQSAVLSENFSIGLVWECKEAHKDITIFRCNGLHGGNKNVEHHNSCHIHKIDIAKLKEDVFSTMTATITTEFTLFSECIYFFGTHCNIIGLDQYFPSMRTFDLFEGQKE